MKIRKNSKTSNGSNNSNEDKYNIIKYINNQTNLI